jgi:Arc/MetJ family transcription regulator
LTTELDTVEDKDIVQSFLRSLRTKQTKETYVLAFRKILRRYPETLLDAAREDKAKAENFPLD